MPIVSQWKKCMKQDWTTAFLTKNSTARHWCQGHVKRTEKLEEESFHIFLMEDDGTHHISTAESLSDSSNSE
jgi:hypothetical protein